MRFVTKVELETIHLKDSPDGTKNWIKIKKRLTAGEDREYRSAGMRRIAPSGNKNNDGSQAIEIDWTDMAMARVMAYLVEWSATEPDPKREGHTRPVPVNIERIKMLDPEDFEEIDKAIGAFLDSEAERKKEMSGGEK